MAGELFKAMAGVSMVHVPYKGSAGARTDVLGGQVDLMFDAIPTMTEHIRSGKVKALATTGKARSAILPDVPTMAEAGVPGYEATIWLGLMAPKGTPAAVVARLNAEIGRITGNAEVRKRLGRPGHDGDDDGRRRVRALPRRRHRQVGKASCGLRR
jgi:tripartite-type tricarboxylate transporter receptor subunit TctC